MTSVILRANSFMENVQNPDAKNCENVNKTECDRFFDIFNQEQNREDKNIKF